MRAHVAVEQIHPAGKFLADGERRGVLQMRAANLDDAGELFGFGVERVAQFLYGRQQASREVSVAAAMCMAVGNVSFDDCDMFTSSFGWIGFLLPIAPPAISMARLPITSLTFMLVCVPLPVCQMRRGKWSLSLPEMTSSAAWAMSLAFSAEQLAQILIHECGGFFQDAEGADQLGRHGVLADGEVDQRAGGLRAVVAVGGDVHLAHGVGFGAGGHVARRLRGVRHWLLLWPSERKT